FDEAFGLYLQDNTQAWVLDAEGHYTRLQPALNELPLAAQEVLMASLGGDSASYSGRLLGEHQPTTMH
ncbi:MAG TPA: hypothetical protein PLM98_05980, partial [Thiolinea sp.]|nr:hypothetical protein [Thiolinea sp.]